MPVDRVSPVGPTDDAFVALFDAYRVHYGRSTDRAGAQRWLYDGLTRGRLLGFRAAPAAGICVVAPCPASLTLGEF